MNRPLTAAAFGVALLLVAATAFAQTALPEGVSQEQIDGALSDLSEVYGFPVVRVDQAKAICNEEQYLEDCAKIGQKHELFSEDRSEQVDAVLVELKGDSIEKLKQCSDVACLVEVASSIAGRLNKEHPAIARAVELTPQKVGEKRGIVEAAASLGVDIEACRTMDPDTASIELLRGCARLAKHENVQKYIPEEARGRAEMSDNSIALKESLTAGEYQCGDGTLQSCGNFCLNPSAEARSAGTSEIPGVCRQLAERFFGPEGIQQLESAYSNVQETYDTFTRRAKSAVFTTTDGRTLTDMNEIGGYLEKAGAEGDVAAVTAGMDFLVGNGFVSADDRNFALTMVGKIREQGPVNFDQCRANPESCAQVVPEGERGQFKVMGEIEKVMRNEMASRGITDPSRCASDSSIGEACMAAARAALPQVEGIAERSPEARSVIENIRRQVRFGEEGVEARKRVEEQFRTAGNVSFGENQFRSIGDFETFCQTNSRECLAESARAGFVSRDVATDRYERSAEVRYAAPYATPYTRPSADPSSYPQVDKAALRAQFEAWLENPNQGQPAPYPMPQPYPSPYPGDPRANGPYPYPYPGDPGRGPVCPFVQAPTPCPSGEYRQESRNEFGCPSYSACIPFNTETQRPRDDRRAVCPAFPTVESCPAGQEKTASFSSPECGTYYSCRTVTGLPTLTPGTDCSRYGFGWHSMDSSGNCFNSAMSEYKTPGGTVQLCSNSPVYGCSGSNTIQPPSPSGQRQQVWSPYGLQSWIRGDADTARIESLKVACAAVRSSANIWMPSAGNSGSADFGMPDPAKCRAAALCTTDQTFDGTACSASTNTSRACAYNEYWDGSACRASTTATTTCPSGQYWSGSSCVQTSTTNCTSDQYWNGSSCVSSGGGTVSGSCSSTLIGLLGDGCHSMGNAWFNSGMTRYVLPSGSVVIECTASSISGCTGGGASTSCPSGQYWNGSSCASTSGDSGNCSSYASQSSCTSVTNCYWYSGSSPYCYYQSSGASSCPSGQYWNGSSCVSSGTTCSSGQYWNGSACVNSTGGGTTDCSQYGSGWHTMDSSGNCFDSAMQNYKTANGTLYSCASTPASGCSTSSSTSCPSGQYWNGSSCVTTSSTTCPSGQYWNGSSCVTTSTTDTASAQSGCTSAGGTWNSSTSYCQMPASSTSCPTGQYWNGSSCVTSSPSTSCSSGQYWDGSACVTSSPSPSTSCGSGQYWDGSACRTTETYTPPPSTSPPPESTPPPETYTPPPETAPTSFLCPTNHDWNGSYCSVASKSTLERYTASVFGAFRLILGF